MYVCLFLLQIFIFEQFMPQKQTQQGENQNRKKYKKTKFKTFFLFYHSLSFERERKKNSTDTQYYAPKIKNTHKHTKNSRNDCIFNNQF